MPGTTISPHTYLRIQLSNLDWFAPQAHECEIDVDAIMGDQLPEACDKRTCNTLLHSLLGCAYCDIDNSSDTIDLLAAIFPIQIHIHTLYISSYFEWYQRCKRYKPWNAHVSNTYSIEQIDILDMEQTRHVFSRIIRIRNDILAMAGSGTIQHVLLVRADSTVRADVLMVT